MRIGLDISKALAPCDGIGHYTAELVRALAPLLAAQQEDELFLYSLGERLDPERVRDRFPELPECVHPRPGRPQEDTLDLFHATAWAFPTHLRARLLFTCYDLTFLSHPECHTLDNRIHCLGATLEALFTDATFVTISQASAQELERRLEVRPSRIRVVYPAASAAFEQRAKDGVRRRLRERLAIEGSFLLAVGTLEPRKNLVALIEAHQGLPDDLRREFPLIAAGGSGWGLDEQELFREANVRHLGYVALDDLVDLYNAAALFAYPSLAEGFGLPLVEAMACGAPVLTSATSALGEVAAGAARLVDPPDAGGIRIALKDLIERPAERERLRQRGFERAADFSWQKTARKTLELYREVHQRQ